MLFGCRLPLNNAWQDRSRNLPTPSLKHCASRGYSRIAGSHVFDAPPRAGCRRSRHGDTGLDPRKARLLQIGAVRIQRGNLDADQRFVKLINPGALIPKASVDVHGITDAMVADAPKFPAVIQDFEAFVGNSFVIGHAIAYDLTVLQREYSLAGQSWPNIRGLDVRLLARIAAPSLADHGLDRLCAWLGIEIVGRHSALGDAIATAKVFLALLPLLRSRNVRTLAEADVATRTFVELIISRLLEQL